MMYMGIIQSKATAKVWQTIGTYIHACYRYHAHSHEYLRQLSIGMYLNTCELCICINKYCQCAGVQW